MAKFRHGHFNFPVNPWIFGHFWGDLGVHLFGNTCHHVRLIGVHPKSQRESVKHHTMVVSTTLPAFDERLASRGSFKISLGVVLLFVYVVLAGGRIVMRCVVVVQISFLTVSNLRSGHTQRWQLRLCANH